MSKIEEFVKLFNEANPADKITEEYRILELYQEHLDEHKLSQPTPVTGESAMPCPMCCGFGEARWGNMITYKKCPSCEGSGQVKTSRSPEHR